MWFKMHPWVFPIILDVIGILYLLINIGAAIETMKIRRAGSDRHVSGIPLLGGIHFLIGGLISPCKWLALLCLLDFAIIGPIHDRFNPDAFKVRDDKDNENEN